MATEVYGKFEDWWAAGRPELVPLSGAGTVASPSYAGISSSASFTPPGDLLRVVIAQMKAWAESLGMPQSKKALEQMAAISKGKPFTDVVSKLENNGLQTARDLSELITKVGGDKIGEALTRLSSEAGDEIAHGVQVLAGSVARSISSDTVVNPANRILDALKLASPDDIADMIRRFGKLSISLAVADGVVNAAHPDVLKLLPRMAETAILSTTPSKALDMIKYLSSNFRDLQSSGVTPGELLTWFASIRGCKDSGSVKQFQGRLYELTVAVNKLAEGPIKMEVRYSNAVGNGVIDLIVNGVMVEAKHGVGGHGARSFTEQFLKHAAQNTKLQYAVPNQQVKNAIMAIINADDLALEALNKLKKQGLWEDFDTIISPWLNWSL